jgi:hypothetical protein
MGLAGVFAPIIEKIPIGHSKNSPLKRAPVNHF